MMTELRCADCSGAISSGRAMKAGHKFWHDHHFCCSDCGSRLREAKVFQKEGRLYCDSDYKRNFVPRCAHCSEFIMQDCVRALEQAWHPEHFACKKCAKVFSKDQAFHEKSSFPYCKPCYVDLVCSKCAGCLLPITDRALKAMDKDWHVECFVCQTCKKSFVGENSFFCVDEKPVCSDCVKE